jgi:hypothetical protein
MLVYGFDGAENGVGKGWKPRFLAAAANNSRRRGLQRLVGIFVFARAFEDIAAVDLLTLQIPALPDTPQSLSNLSK